ncbi:hypothetical protein DFJ43DRAFT_1035240 [Lentinula guzmanii]|uniref:Uncharacterized protein n=1 Tax=Lentinula guzmanii TaxID=2804957 RepID=A0AA38N5W5_9AGAR|nr:hypothetical protein DFJ43DRAFT_1035240 [Lentinula guzmanii]
MVQSSGKRSRRIGERKGRLLIVSDLNVNSFVSTLVRYTQALFSIDMLSLTRLLPALHLLVSILAVSVTAAPIVNNNESGKQLVSFMLSTNRLQPLPLEKYDAIESWRWPSTLDVGIRIGTIPYYASRDPYGNTVLIERGTNRVTGQPKIDQDRANGLILGTVKMGKEEQETFWNDISNFEYSSKLEFLEQVLGKLSTGKGFDFEQDKSQEEFQKSMVAKVKRLGIKDLPGLAKVKVPLKAFTLLSQVEINAIDPSTVFVRLTGIDAALRLGTSGIKRADMSVREEKKKNQNQTIVSKVQVRLGVGMPWLELVQLGSGLDFSSEDTM